MKQKNFYLQSQLHLCGEGDRHPLRAFELNSGHPRLLTAKPYTLSGGNDAIVQKVGTYLRHSAAAPLPAPSRRVGSKGGWDAACSQSTDFMILIHPRGVRASQPERSHLFRGSK